MIKTKYGNAKINDDGYYVITSRKEGFHNKKLSRLVWEDYWGCEIPIGYIIHHIDGCKTNNDITNLVCLSDYRHKQLHQVGRLHTEKTKKLISKNSRVENKGLFGSTGATLSNGIIAENKPWMCRIRYNKYTTHIGYYSDFVTCEVIYKLVLKEIF